MSAPLAALAHPWIFVEAEWLAAHLDEADLRVIDCTVRIRFDPAAVGPTRSSGREDFTAQVGRALGGDQQRPRYGNIRFWTAPRADRYPARLGIEHRSGASHTSYRSAARASRSRYGGGMLT
jgi:hypothetical protein